MIVSEMAQGPESKSCGKQCRVEVTWAMVLSGSEVGQDAEWKLPRARHLLVGLAGHPWLWLVLRALFFFGWSVGCEVT